MRTERSLRAMIALASAAAAVLLAGCPLPFDFNARGAGSSNTVDPSSPKMTAPVTVSYSVQGGTSGTVADGGSFTSGQTTTVTLATATENAIIYYTDDGTAITNVNSVRKITASSGSFTITRTTGLQAVQYHAVAIGPNMVPSPQVSATVSVSPYPILTITRDKAATSEAGGTATFTVTSSVAPSSPVTVRLQTSGSYGAAFVSGVPSSGTIFTATLAAATTSFTIPISCSVDPDAVDNDLGLAILADTAIPPAYSVGAPAGASLTIQDNNAPVLTLSADRSMMTDAETATFTVTASFAPNSNRTVAISSTGYTAGTVNVPASVTLLAGQTTAQFQVTAVSQVGYQVQNPQISIAPAAGYTLGSPVSLGLQISDDAVGAFTYNGVWTFNSGTGSNVGTGSSWNLTGNVTLGGGGLTFGGVYASDDAQIGLGSSFDVSAFTIGVQFTLADLSVVHPVIVAGPGWRWLILWADTSGNLYVTVNNSVATVPSPTGLAVSAGVLNTVVLTVDEVNLTIKVGLNGTTVALTMPGAFNTGPGPDTTLTANNYSNGTAFKGTWNWVFVSEGLLTYGDVVSLVTTDPKI